MSLTCMTAGAASDATLVKVPTENPTFSLSLPGSWTVTPNVNSGVLLQCTANDSSDKSTYSLLVIPLKGATDDADIKVGLPVMVKGMADNMGIKGLESGNFDTTTNKNQVPFTCIKSTGAGDGLDWVIFMQAFKAQEGECYVLCTLATKDALDRHEKDFQAIYNSVKLLKP